MCELGITYAPREYRLFMAEVADCGDSDEPMHLRTLDQLAVPDQ